MILSCGDYTDSKEYETEARKVSGFKSTIW